MKAVSDHNRCLVSVITPCYNAERFIAATIDSVLAQSVADWEMIVADDGSTDASPAIVASYATRDSRITLVTLNRHSGASHARNTAIQQARGRYLAFLDSDDLWLPDKLAKQLAFMTDHDLAFSYGSYQLIDTEGHSLGTFVTEPSITYASLLKTCSVGCLTAMYDTRKLGKLYLPDIEQRQDYVLWHCIV
ncbi:MAG: glycosyltransferase family 2 protein [Nitrospira sp.]|nr:glycosyltransferase family 2 protein [Nitrospira sp.]